MKLITNDTSEIQNANFMEKLEHKRKHEPNKWTAEGWEKIKRNYEKKWEEASKIKSNEWTGELWSEFDKYFQNKKKELIEQNPSVLICEIRESLKEKQAELLRKQVELPEKQVELRKKREILCKTLKKLQVGEEYIKIKNGFIKGAAVENSLFVLKGREEYSEMEFDDIFLTEWKDYPSFALVLKIFSIYYEFSISESNIIKYLDYEHSDDIPTICGIKISVLDRYNRDELNNTKLLVIAALLYVVNTEMNNGNKLEIFPRFNKKIDKEKYNNYQNVYEKIEYVYEVYNKEKEIQDFLKPGADKKITFLDRETLAFVYATKMELEAWEHFEIEKKKYNLECKSIIQIEYRKFSKLPDEVQKKIQDITKDIEKYIDTICLKNEGYAKKKVEICEACAWFVEDYEKAHNSEEEFKEELEWKALADEEQELVTKIKEELTTYEDFTRGNIIDNIEFISREIDNKIEKLVNTYGNLNEFGQREYLQYVDSVMQLLDEEYSYEKFCARQYKKIEMDEIDKLLDPMSYYRKETIYNYLHNSTFALFSKEDWYVFYSIGIAKMKHRNVLEELCSDIRVFTIQKRFQSDE